MTQEHETIQKMAAQLEQLNIELRNTKAELGRSRLANSYLLEKVAEEDAGKLGAHITAITNDTVNKALAAADRKPWLVEDAAYLLVAYHASATGKFSSSARMLDALNKCFPRGKP